MEKQFQDKNQEYKHVREIADYRKSKLEKLLRKLNRGLEDHESYIKSIEDDNLRESAIAEDVVKSGKIAKPIKGKRILIQVAAGTHARIASISRPPSDPSRSSRN